MRGWPVSSGAVNTGWFAVGLVHAFVRFRRARSAVRRAARYMVRDCV
jgi:hypothetical protein